ncbi:MAG: hypothetical protein WBS19_11535 [Candidatus Korobacteraceae bacterium]
MPSSPSSADLDGEVTSAPATPQSSAANWWRVGDFCVLGLWVAITTFTLNYHEKWADEAQAWLIARDLSLWRIFSYELRYEGSPGLWHLILWIAQHIFHAPYATLGPLGLVFATAGVAFLIFFAPFPRPLRWLLAFSYFMVYQYAVIARPYTLLPLFCFLAAYFFRDLQHPGRMTVVLVLLANLTLHGTIIAGCLGLVYLLDAIRAWPTFDQQLRRRYWICIGIMAATFLFIVAILMPTKDVAEFAAAPELPGTLKATPIQKIYGILSGAFFDHPLPSIIFLALAGGWCFLRKRLLIFALPVLILIALYVKVHGYAHHHGTVFVAAITALWIAWPTPEESATFGIPEVRATQAMTALLACLALFNVWDAAYTIRNEYRYPYSGAPDVVQYLNSAGAGKLPIFGYLYGVAAVQAYYDHNILSNIPTTYFHHGLPRTGNSINEEELDRLSPEYVILFSEAPQIMYDQMNGWMNAKGYKMVHFSDGYFLYKRFSYERQSYLIYKRVTP